MSISDKYRWEQATFECDYSDGEEIPIIKSEFSTMINKESQIISNSIELRNIIMKSSKKFNYKLCGLELNTVVSLKGESSFWIFTRAPENLSSISKPNVFNRHSSVIKITKEDKCQNVLFHLGYLLKMKMVKKMVV